MASRTTSQDFYSSSSSSSSSSPPSSPSSYQPQALHQTATSVPIQRSRSLPNERSQILDDERPVTSIGDRPPVSSLSNDSHTPHQYQNPPQPAVLISNRPPSQRPPLNHQSARREFQTGASLAAVAYQLSPQKQYPAPPRNIMYTYPAYPPQAYAPYAPHYMAANEFGGPAGPISIFPYSSSYPPYPTEMPVMSAPQPCCLSHPHHHHQHYTPAMYYAMPQQHMEYLHHNARPQMIPHGQMVYPSRPEHFRRHSVPPRPTSMQIIPGGMSSMSPSVPNFQVPNSNLGNSPNFSSPSPKNVSGSPSPQPTVLPSIPRGPPRKPKQSGNALWVGNLPPDTDLSALKDHFSKGSKDEIQSVFLISKTSCAFVNYRTENGSMAAMARFHNSLFNGARLVCRPRKTSEPEHTEHVEQASEVGSGIEASTDEADTESKDTTTDTATGGTPCINTSNSRFRYFVLKSLTLEDLDMSVRTGTWATQGHNETVLNEAFDAAESVFLVFSGNKSGEYHGYARMVSRIGSDETKSIQTTQYQSQSLSGSDLLVPRITYTLETDTAPRGRIVDDSSRGTLFWETLYDNELEDMDASGQSDGDSNGSTISTQKSWGIPFRVEWISTTRVPFFKTRGIRNFLNAGREVKVARDGTELEPGAGRRLVQLFHERYS
ncbi:YT521-B-like domain-containing protein [Pyronema omphalodes]|nr:YT521-B-like domain-containing protein [Pyronema omphalodes]